MFDTEEAPGVWLWGGELGGDEEVGNKGALLGELRWGESLEEDLPAVEVLLVAGPLGVVEVCGMGGELVGFVLLFAPVLVGVLVGVFAGVFA